MTVNGEIKPPVYAGLVVLEGRIESVLVRSAVRFNMNNLSPIICPNSRILTSLNIPWLFIFLPLSFLNDVPLFQHRQIGRRQPKLLHVDLLIVLTDERSPASDSAIRARHFNPRSRVGDGRA
jgi:hypothetical protein